MELRTNKRKSLNESANAERVITKLKKENSNIHKDHRSRLKSQFINNGIEALSDIQKLEMLLFYALPQKDTNPLAHALLTEFGSLKDVICADYNSLVKVDGIKENTATLIKFFGSMLNYCSRPDDEEILNNSSKAKNVIAQYFNHLSVEQFYIFCLTKSNRLKKAVLVNSGTSSEVDVQIRTLTEIAIDNRCARIIIAHNHPNGKAIMSGQDCRFTYSLICSCILNNIEVIDHIIVGTDKTISLYEQGIIAKLKNKASHTIQIPKENNLFLSEEIEGYEKSMVDEPPENAE